MTFQQSQIKKKSVFAGVIVEGKEKNEHAEYREFEDNETICMLL
jgi:hypothetical protein